MDLLPSELGIRRNVALLRLRAAGGVAANPAVLSGAASFTPVSDRKKRLGPLGRWWNRGTGLPPDAAAHVMEGMKGTIGGFLGGLAGGGGGGFLGPATGLIAENHLLGAALGAAGLSMIYLGFSMPGVLLRRWQRSAVTAAEVETLLGSTQDDLERAYLLLVQDAVRRFVPEETEKELRTALRALGEAIDRLPAHASAPISDTEALRRDANKARADAMNESDLVVAASLERRADALERSAGAVEQSAVLIRRMSALRNELLAQTEALRLGLAAFDTGAGHLSDLSYLAESVRGVAAEAASVSAARGELDMVVSNSDAPAGSRIASAPQHQPEIAVLRRGGRG